MRHTRLFAALVIVSVLPVVGHAEQAELRRLSFLAGRWISEGPGSVEEESWSPPAGDSMVGTFRVLKDGRPVFYEFWAVEVENGRPVLKLKHFDAGLKGWEEKEISTRMPVRSLTSSTVEFAQEDGAVVLRYQRQGDTLISTVRHVRQGTESTETFRFHRAR